MKRFWELIKRKKNYLYVVLTLVLLLLMTSVCSLSANVNVLGMTELDKGTVKAYNQTGYEIREESSGRLEYHPQNGDPQITIPVSGTLNSRITVHFSEGETHSAQAFQLYYRGKDDVFSEDKTAIAFSQQDQILFLIYDADFDELRLDVNEPFSLESISIETWELSGSVRSFQWIPAITLVILLALLGVFNSKIGYYTRIKSIVTRIYLDLREEFEQKKHLVALLHIAMLLVTVLYSLCLLGLLLLSYFTKSAIVIMTVLTALTVLFQLLYRLVSGKGVQAATLFLIVGLLIGLYFAYALPPTMQCCYDDEIHYYRTELISRTFLGHQRTIADYGQAVRTYICADSVADLEGVNLWLLFFDQHTIYEKGHLFNFYLYIAYVPLSFLIAFCDLFAVDFLLQMAILKMANLLMFVFICYLGLRKLKSGAYLFASIALSPISLFLAVSISYDFWVTAWLLYAFCVFLSEMQQPEKKLTTANLIRIVAAMIIGCGPKAIYFALVIPLLFMSKSKFTDGHHRKIYIRTNLIAMGLILLSFAVPFLFDVGDATDLRGGTEVNSLGQVKFILGNPIQYLLILLRFMSNYLSLGMANDSITLLAYLGRAVPICSTLSILLIAFCVFADKKECDSFVNVRSFKWMTVLSSFATVALVATALYVSFTPVGNAGINGVQWRYLLPVLSPLLYCVGSTRITSRIKERTMSGVVFSVISVTLLACFVQLYVVALG